MFVPSVEIRRAQSDLKKGTRDEMGKLITSKTYSTEDGIWLLFLASMEKGVLLMVDEDVLNMGTGIDGFMMTTDGSGDRGANPCNSTASSSAMSGMI